MENVIRNEIILKMSIDTLLKRIQLVVFKKRKFEYFKISH